jgi:pyruvate/2-oxoglutarate dehydrogenase complex dihydrolipoamide acyltransferase (E2) component
LFGRRPDADLVRNAPAMRRIMPHVSPRRNESVFYLPDQIEVEAALEFLEKHNQTRPSDRPGTLFHLLLHAIAQEIALNPRTNRFVKGGRLWQRRGIYLTFSAKREMSNSGALVTIKRRFDPESLDEMIDGVYALLRPARRGVESTSDKETNLLVRLPNVLTGVLVRASEVLDRFGLLPLAMIEPDPMFTTVFVANLGSVGLDAGFHHLWERGTCSAFSVIGRIKPGPSGRRVVNVTWTWDERVEDGLYVSTLTNGVRERLESPELLLASLEELRAGSSS